MKSLTKCSIELFKNHYQEIFLSIFLPEVLKKLSDISEIMKVDYFNNLRNLFSTLSLAMVKKNLHVLAFDLFNLMFFKDIKINYLMYANNNIKEIINENKKTFYILRNSKNKITNHPRSSFIHTSKTINSIYFNINSFAKKETSNVLKEELNNAKKATSNVLKEELNNAKKETSNVSRVELNNEKIFFIFPKHYTVNKFISDMKKNSNYVNLSKEKSSLEIDSATLEIEPRIIKNSSEKISDEIADHEQGKISNDHIEKIKNIYKKIERNFLQFVDFSNSLEIALNDPDSIIDEFLTNTVENFPGESLDKNLYLDFDLFHTKTKISKMINYNEDVDGIRRISRDRDIVNLLPSQYGYFEDTDLFNYMYSTNELLTYSIPANIISNKNVLISFTEIVSNDCLSRLYNENNNNNYFYVSLIKQLLFQSMYKFIYLKNNNEIDKFFENKFHFSYQYFSPDNIILNIEDNVIREDFIYDLIESGILENYDSFRTQLLTYYPKFFSYDILKKLVSIKNVSDIVKKYKSSKYDIIFFNVFIKGVSASDIDNQKKNIKRIIKNELSKKIEVFFIWNDSKPVSEESFIVERVKTKVKNEFELKRLPITVANLNIKSLLKK